MAVRIALAIPSRQSAIDAANQPGSLDLAAKRKRRRIQCAIDIVTRSQRMDAYDDGDSQPKYQEGLIDSSSASLIPRKATKYVHHHTCLMIYPVSKSGPRANR
jgi:hypothetical protein